MPFRSPRPVAFISTFFALWIAALLVGRGIRPLAAEFVARLAFGDIERLIFWLLLPALWLLLIEHRPIATAFYPVERRSGFWAVNAAMLFAATLFLGVKLTRGHWIAVPAGHSVLEYLMVGVSVGLLALGEEFTFRGVALSGLMRKGMPFALANLVVAVAFAFSHWPGWLLFGSLPPVALATATLRVLIFGILMGGLVRLEGGLTTAILIHWLNDILAGTLF